MCEQYERIWSSDWKVLIILDACRYDYFERVLRDYEQRLSSIEYSLSRVRSCGWYTIMWLKNVFRAEPHLDVIYISANPIINSKGVTTLDFRQWVRVHKIVNVWDWGWDSSLETVHPREVYKAYFINSKIYKNKRFIVHFLQPHSPYIELSLRGLTPSRLRGRVKRRFRDRVKGFIRWRLVDLFGEKQGKRIAERIVGPPPLPPNYVKIVAQKFGVRTLHRLYENNLRIVMDYVVKIIKACRDKAIVTSDHGEMLGEHGLYEHSYIREGYKYPELALVPWLETYS